MTPADRLARSRGQAGFLLEDGRHGLGGGLALERAAAGQHLVEHDAEREQVGAAVDGLAADLLGRHVADRAEHSSWIGRDDRLGRAALAHRLGQTEIENLHLPVTREKQVLGLQIAVDDAFAVRGERPRAIWLTMSIAFLGGSGARPGCAQAISPSRSSVAA